MIDPHRRDPSPSVYTIQSLTRLIDSIPMAIVVIDSHRAVVLANKTVYAFTNKKKERLVGQVGGEAFGCTHHQDVPQGCGFGPACLRCELRKTVIDTIDQGRAHSMIETTMGFLHHGKMDLRISTLPLELEKEPVVLVIMEDVTEAKKLEQVRLDKERLSAVLKTAAAVCHEISQPLMVILGRAEMLAEDLADSDIGKENLDELIAHVERLAHISRKLTTISSYRTKPYLNGEIIDIHAASGDQK